MDNDLFKLSLIQGNQFNQYQKKIMQNINTKEGFVTKEQEIMLRPEDEGYVSVLKNQYQIKNLTNKVNQKDLDEFKELQAKYNDLMLEYKTIQTTITKKILSDINNVKYKKNKISKNAQHNTLISQEYKIKLDSVKNKLYLLGQDLALKMEILYNKDKKIYEKMDMNAEEFKKNLEKYKNIKNYINDNIEGMQNMNDINGMLSDTDLRVLQENYSYILWSILAVGILTITINTMNK